MTAVDTTVAYRDGRVRITDVLRSVPAEVGDRVAPACPAWTVKDVVAHLCGVDADIVAGRLDGIATDAWTDAQVRARAHRSLAEVLDEWDEIGPEVEGLLAGGLAPAQMVFDLATHEHDIRQAVGVPGGRDADSTLIAIDFALDGWAAVFPTDTCPPLRLVAGDRSVDLGSGDPETTLALSAFEALRALTGRRSPAQVLAYDWAGDGDGSPWLPAFTWGPFTPASHNIEG